MGRIGLLLALSSVLTTAPAVAQVVGPDLSGGHKLSFMASGFWADINTIARADGNGGRLGTRLDLEKDLGFDDNKVRFVGGLSYQFNRRHAVILSYFDLNRSAQRTLSADIDFLNQTFERSTTLESSFDTEIWRVSYAYAFLDSAQHRATAQVGLHWPRIAMHLSRTEGTRNADASADGPLPVLGLTYTYRFSPRWMFDVRGQIFRLQMDDIDGSMDNFSAALAVAALQNVTIFAGYNYYKLKADVSKRFWNGQANFDYQGPWVGTVIAFGGPGQQAQ
jgi:hypothetical protein